MNSFILKGKYIGLEKGPNSILDNLIKDILVDDEEIVFCAKKRRLGVVFTTKRIISVCRKGISPFNRELSSIPYNMISTFSWEQKEGFSSFTSKLVIYVSAMGRAEFVFKGSKETGRIYKIIAERILSN